MYAPLLAVTACLILIVGMYSRRMDGSPITAPMIFLCTGFALGPWGLGVLQFTVDEVLVQHFVEFTLILVLFAGGANTPVGRLLQDRRTTIRLLAIGIPLNVAIGSLLATYFFPQLGAWRCALLAAVLTPTDAALGQVALSGKDVPERLKETLTVESGLNDGLMVPIILFLTAFDGLSEGREHLLYWSYFITQQVGFGFLVGYAVAWLGRRGIQYAHRRHSVEPIFEQLVMVALAVLAFAASELINGNGLVAAFVAGATLRHLTGSKFIKSHDATAVQAELFSLVTFLLFGAVMVPPALLDCSWQMVVFAALSLTFIRMAACAGSLVGLSAPWKEQLFIGWMGPRGIASLLFGLIVLEVLDIPKRHDIFQIVTITVAMSVMLHGALAPLAKRLVRVD